MQGRMQAFKLAQTKRKFPIGRGAGADQPEYTGDLADNPALPNEPPPPKAKKHSARDHAIKRAIRTAALLHVRKGAKKK